MFSLWMNLTYQCMLTGRRNLSQHYERLILTLRKINPNMQLIIATHAPSLIEGWFDKVKEVCEISQDID